MLTESFVVSLGTATDNARVDPTRDASIILIDHQPVVQQQTSFKKSATASNCLAISTSHIFAAQADKAVVNVYNRSKGNQESTVPFTEKITCITLTCNDTVLVLGTVEGRLFLWEIATGRQVTTTQSHLQTITCLAADATSNFLISTSADATARVWALPTLLSFQTDIQSALPCKTFDSHRSSITAVALGHSASSRNLAITIADDRTCLIWDYHSAETVFTFLLSSMPKCVQFDPADRAAYIGYDDGSVQQLDLLSLAAAEPNSSIQPGNKKRWTVPESSHGAALTLAVIFDGTQVLTGHQSGAILLWDVATGHMRPLNLHPQITRPATALQFLPVSGFRSQRTVGYAVESIVKPKFGAFQSSSATVPGNYAAHLHLAPSKVKSSFQEALTASTIPQSWLDQGLAELGSWSQPAQKHVDEEHDNDDFVAFEDKSLDQDLQKQNEQLKLQLEALRRVQNASFDRIEKLSAERKALIQREQRRIQNNSMANDYDDDD